MKPIFLIIGACAILLISGIVYAVVTISHNQTAKTETTTTEQTSASTSKPYNFSDGGASTSPQANTPLPGNALPPGQPGQPGQQGQRGQRMQMMYDQLGLSDAQKQQIAQIRQTVTDRQQRRDQIRAILTPEQQAKLDQIRADFRNRFPGGRGPGGQNGQGGGQGQPMDQSQPQPQTQQAPGNTAPAPTPAGT